MFLLIAAADTVKIKSLTTSSRLEEDVAVADLPRILIQKLQPHGSSSGGGGASVGRPLAPVALRSVDEADAAEFEQGDREREKDRRRRGDKR